MRNSFQISLFASACTLPGVLLITAAVLGGGWPWVALASVTLWVLVMDRTGPAIEAMAPLTRPLPVLVGVLHFISLGATLWAVGESHLDVASKVVLVLGMGLVAGQVSNACAHELIHRQDRTARRLGTAIYCSLLNGHHVSAHLLVHHIHAGTAKDPNSAPLGQSFYRYLLRATRAEFLAGLHAETQRRQRTGRLHPYTIYLAGAALSLMAAGYLGGLAGLVALLFIAVHAQSQLLLSDYIQHYGLQRRVDAGGKPEPMGPQHSWNAPQPYSAALMMNAPRHSDHHTNPQRDFTRLDLHDDMPLLPRSVPVMGAVALFPPLWHRMMDHRARAWSCHTPEQAARPATGTLPARPEPVVLSR